MTDNALKIIKDELARIEKDEDHILAGRQGNMIKYLTKALSVAVEALEDVNHGFSKSGLRYGGMQYEQISAKAITTIANILSGGKDGK